MIRVVVGSVESVEFEGQSYAPGRELELPEEVARKWMAMGWVTPVSEREADDKDLTKNQASRDAKHHENGPR